MCVHCFNSHRPLHADVRNLCNTISYVRLAVQQYCCGNNFLSIAPTGRDSHSICSNSVSPATDQGKAVLVSYIYIYMH